MRSQEISVDRQPVENLVERIGLGLIDGQAVSQANVHDGLGEPAAVLVGQPLRRVMVALLRAVQSW